ncbi:MAG: CapA family protein [Actinomycetota bacterium]
MFVSVSVLAPGCGTAGSKSGGEPGLSGLWESFEGLRAQAGGMVSVSAGGDVNFGDGVTPTLTANGTDYPFADAKDALTYGDLAFVNLECAISSGGSPVPGKEFTFEGPPDSVNALVDGGINVVSVANNHSKDYGTAAFTDTLANLKEAGIAVCGGGADSAQAYSPAVLEAGGAKVAFVAFCNINPAGWPAGSSTPGVATCNDEDKVAETIREAGKKADYVVASFHWGVELATTPSDDQVRLGRLAVDSGADLVLGHHPHVVQGMELYKNRLIAYSLGNYVFSPPREISARTMTVIAMMGPDGLVQARIVPMFIRGCRPVVASGEAGASWLSTIAGYCEGLGTEMSVIEGRGFIRGKPAAPSKQQ